jgi:hypothetical protein
MAKHVPLTSGFMLTSIIGFFVSSFYVMKLDLTWGFTFSLFFVIMFIASIISMSKIEAEDKYGLQELDIHHKEHYSRKRRKE